MAYTRVGKPRFTVVSICSTEFILILLIIIPFIYTTNVNLLLPVPVGMSVQKVSSHVIWKIETFIKEDMRNIVHRTMMPQSPTK